MTVPEALKHAEEWTRGTTFYEGQGGWRVAVAVLAKEVNSLKDELAATGCKDRFCKESDSLCHKCPVVTRNGKPIESVIDFKDIPF